ncbi:MAG: prolipoprotein diacylglyceryl transferase, partial [Oscillospiraceae bacterium]|nr:prolipoprotein diacylglyceryl transferase [Oscillospiraceae bacterium]
MKPLGVLEENQVVFPRLGLEFEISDTAFTVFGLEIKWYGIFITIGLLLAMIYAFKNMKSYGIDPDRAIDVIIGGVIGGIVGARAYYVFLNWDSYSGDFFSMFNLRNGGLAVYGGIIGAV